MRPDPPDVAPVVLKLGGELLESDLAVAQAVRAIAAFAASAPLVVVHGGGREIDAELAARGIERRTIDGLRITDEPTLHTVIAVLAGLVNTRLCAALGAHGVRAVGLTGADAGIALVEEAPPHHTTDGRQIRLGLVGQPLASSSASLLVDLCTRGYVPVVASIGASADGRLFNVNADTLAAHLARTCGARMTAERWRGSDTRIWTD
jgi:acetylglutamate kinase